MKHRDITSDVLPPAEGDAEGRKVVAVVGIDRYRAWPTLDNAVSDAKGALGVFQQLGFEQIVAPLINETATADAIRRLVTDDLATLRSDDSLVLFFAGHGHTQTRTLQSGPVETGYIIPVDGDRPDGHVATWLRLDTWLSDVARLPARHILVILDACHSGIVLGSLIKWRDGGDAGRGDSLDALRRRQSRRVITSALGDQRAMDGGPIPGHSLFTGCLIEGLTGGLARDGRREATGSELGIYVQQRVTSFTGSQQTPDFGALELDHRGELVVPVATDARSSPSVPAPPIDVKVSRSRTAIPQSGSGVMVRWDVQDARRQSAAKVAVKVIEDDAAALRPERRVSPMEAPEPNPIILGFLKLSFFPFWMLSPKHTSALLAPLAVWLGMHNRWIGVVGFSLMLTLLGPCTTRSGTSGILWIIASLLIVILIVVGRVIAAAPAIVRSLSARLLQRKFWTASAIGGVLCGASMGMSMRSRLDRECSEQLAAGDALRQASRQGASMAFVDAAKACEAINREDDARRATQAAAEAKTNEAAHRDPPVQANSPEPAQFPGASCADIISYGDSYRGLPPKDFPKDLFAHVIGVARGKRPARAFMLDGKLLFLEHVKDRTLTVSRAISPTERDAVKTIPIGSTGPREALVDVAVGAKTMGVTLLESGKHAYLLLIDPQKWTVLRLAEIKILPPEDLMDIGNLAIGYGDGKYGVLASRIVKKTHLQGEDLAAWTVYDEKGAQVMPPIGIGARLGTPRWMGASFVVLGAKEGEAEKGAGIFVLPTKGSDVTYVPWLIPDQKVAGHQETHFIGASSISGDTISVAIERKGLGIDDETYVAHGTAGGKLTLEKCK